MKKITIHSEFAYPLYIILLAIAVAMCTMSGFGVSMIVAPAYILSLKFDWLSFGGAEYIVQGILIILLCLILKKVKWEFAFSFLTCFIYGFVLDLVTRIPVFNTNCYPPETLDLWIRILYFAGGVLLTGLSVAIIIRIYLYPQVYDFFTKMISKYKKIDFFKIKIAFDVSCLIATFATTLILFHNWTTGVGIGTILMVVLNSLSIKLSGIILDKCVTFKTLFPKFEALFDLDKNEAYTTDEQTDENEKELVEANDNSKVEENTNN